MTEFLKYRDQNVTTNQTEAFYFILKMSLLFERNANMRITHLNSKK